MFKRKKEQQEGLHAKPVNPEMERESEEKALETGDSKDFHDAGGFPRPPVAGGFM